MVTRRITINGQEYDSPDAMPPDVRRTYEAALRSIASSGIRAGTSDTTQVVTGSDTGIVTRTTVTTVHRSPGAGGAQLASSPARPPLPGGAQVRTVVRFETPRPEEPLPLEPGSARAKARHFVGTLIFWVIVALVLWAFLDR